VHIRSLLAAILIRLYSFFKLLALNTGSMSAKRKTTE